MKKLIEISVIGALAVVFAGFPLAIAGQKAVPGPAPADGVSRPGRPSPLPPPTPRWSEQNPDTIERSIKVDAGVTLQFGCISEGNIRVSGWNRNEVRVFVVDGNRFTFRTAESNPKTGAPVWVKVVGVNALKKYGPESECISGDDIAVDVPVNATVRIAGREVSASIDSVKKVDIKSTGGDISIRGASYGITANIGRGDVTVDGSKGPMSLTTTEGNIVVFEGGPSEIGDTFRANTQSGTISLQSLEYRQINVDSITGSVSYNGNILSGGSYNLRTTKGSIRMLVPMKSSFRVWATYGQGSFASDIPVDIITENYNGPIKSISGKAGTGDATLKVTATNGSIAIRKQ